MWTRTLKAILVLRLLVLRHHITAAQPGVWKGCNSPVGVADGRVEDAQLMGSSAYNDDWFMYGPQRARLNSTSFPRGYRTKTSGALGSWIRVQLRENMIITGVATQGHGDVGEWVTEYSLLMENFFQDFVGNNDSNTIKYNWVSRPAAATYVILMPKTVHKNVGLRLELYGCPLDFYFVAWFVMDGREFYVNQHLDSSNAYYKETVQEAMYLVDECFGNIPGFVSAEMLRLSPVSLDDAMSCSIRAEVKIYCIESSMKEVESEIRFILKNDFTGFDTSYFQVQYSKNKMCPPPLVNVSLGKTISEARVVKPSERFVRIGSTVVNRCDDNDETLSCKWEQAKLSGEGELLDPFVPGTGIRNFISSQLILFTTGAGYYLFRCNVNGVNAKGTVAYDFGFVKILKPKPVAKIQGPDIALWKSPVTLSAAGSYESVEKKISPKGMHFRWFCRRLEDENFVEVKQCGGCFSSRPEISSSRIKEIVFNTTVMEPDRTYVFKVTVTQLRVYQNSTTHTLRVEKFASIVCRENCLPKARTARRTVIGVACHRVSCDSDILRYDWSLYVLRNQQWKEIGNLEEMTAGEINGPSLIFPGKTFLPENTGAKYLESGVEYKVCVNVYVKDGMVVKDELTFSTNAPPNVTSKADGCSVSPAVGSTLETEFKIWCSGWHDDDLPLTYAFLYRSNTSVVFLQSGPEPRTKAILPLGNPENDYNFTLEVLVKDSFGSFTTQEVIVKVKPLNDSLSDAINSFAISKNSKLDSLLQNSDHSGAIQFAHALLSMCEDKPEMLTKQQAKLVSGVILQKLGKVELSSLEHVSQLSAIVRMATGSPQFLSEETAESAVEVLEKAVGFLPSHASNVSHEHVFLQQSIISPLQAISNIINSTTERTRDNPAKDSKNVQTATRALKLVDDVGSALLNTKEIGEEASIVRTNQMTMVLEKQTPDEAAKKQFGQKSSVSLPSAEDLLSGQPSAVSSLGIQVIEFAENPYTWDKSSSEVKSMVIDFAMKMPSGERLEVSGLKKPVELNLPLNVESPNSNGTVESEYFVKPGVADENMRYHVVDIPAKTTVALTIKPQESKSVRVFVRYGVRPTTQHYNFSTVLPDFSSCVEPFYNNYNCSSSPFLITISAHLTGNSGRHFIGIKINNDTSNDQAPANDVTSRDDRNAPPDRTRRDCGNDNRRKKRSCIGVKDPPTTPPPTPRVVVPRYNASTDITYTMSMTAASCIYWSKEKNEWVDDGCEVGPKSVVGKLQCLCTHLSVFGGDFLVAPNPIDFDKVWSEFSKLGETGNFVVLSTVCSLLGLYLLALVFAWRADKKDKQKVVAQVYLYECKEDGFIYDISVQTGMWIGYGTTANVALIIYGEVGKTPLIVLTDANFKQKFFARGSVNNFTLCLPQPLGPLIKIEIWHDNSGKNPSWYLQQVVIHDVKNDETYHFLGNRWLALEKGSGEIDACIAVATEKDLRGFRNLFYSRTARSLGDGHLWLSVFTRPPQNPFTRCQRLSCCLCVLFTALVTNAMFYQFGAAPKDTFKLGPLELSLIQIKIGIQSSIVSIPVNVLLVMIFRNVKQKSRGHYGEIGLDERKAPGCLPAFFVYVGWVICLLTSLTAAAFTVFYGLMWGTDVSNRWLSSITISFMQDVLITQPIKVVAIAALLSLIIKKPPEQDVIHGDPLTYEKQNTPMSELKGEKLKMAKERRIKIRKMTGVVFEIVSFLVFTLLLFVVTYGNRTTSRFWLTNGMQDMVKGFQKVKDVPSFWDWTKQKLVPGLYKTQWYNGREFDYDEGFVSTREAFMVGMPRLRQLRVNPEARCPAADTGPRVAQLFPRCLAQYSEHNEYTTRYNLPGWTPIKNSTHFKSVPGLRDLCPKPWRYKPAEDLGTLAHLGLRYSYPGGGFAADLGYNARSAMKVINDLEKNVWIDDRTPVVFVEFTVFEPATALFSAVRYMYETFPSGGHHTSTRVDTLTLYYPTEADFRSFFQVCQMLLIILIFIFLLVELKKLYSNGCKYFKCFWNWVELLLVVGSTSAILMFLFKESYTSDFVKNVQANPFETSSTDHIVYWADLEIALIAFAIFIITVKLLTLLRFNRYICQMSGTLELSVKEIMSFTSMFAVLIMAFTQLGLLVFGNDVKAYSSIYASLRSLLLMLVGGRMYLKDTAKVDPVISPVFAFCYMITMMVVLMNMFCAILCDCHDQVKGVEGKQLADAELGEFMKEYFGNIAKNIWNSLIEFFKERKRTRRTNRETHEQDSGESEQERRQMLLDRLASDSEDTDDAAELASIARSLSNSMSSLKTLSSDDKYLGIEDVEADEWEVERMRTIWDRLD